MSTMSSGPAAELADVYRAYLRCLNERRWNDLGQFVSPRLTYNEKPMTIDDYREAREGEALAIPDLGYTIDLLVADTNTVGARLLFRCTPERPFLGFQPTGATISFAEHVFYRFDGSKIAHVSSLIDVPAIGAQLGQ